MNQALSDMDSVCSRILTGLHTASSEAVFDLAGSARTLCGHSQSQSARPSSCQRSVRILLGHAPLKPVLYGPSELARLNSAWHFEVP